MHDDGTGATGVVMCGSDGRLRAASARWINLVGKTLLAEVEALRDGVRLIPAGTRNTSLWRLIPMSWLRFGEIEESTDRRNCGGRSGV